MKGMRIAALLALAPFLVAGDCGELDLDDEPTGPDEQSLSVWIESPVSGSSYWVGESVLFKAAVAGDSKSVSDGDFEWVSSRQGALGTGRQFSRDDLLEGPHTITLKFKGDIKQVISIAVQMPAAVVLEDDFDDGSPVDGRWRKETAYQAGGVIDSVRHESKGGNPDDFRYMVHVFPDSGQVSVWHFYTGGVYVPSEQGAISHIIYQEDRRQIDKPTPNAAIGTLFIVEQGGTVYWAPISAGNAFSSEGWERVTTPTLKASAFSPAGLDFSAAGDTIKFGYLRSNTNHGHNALTLKHGIDNWRVEVHRQQP